MTQEVAEAGAAAVALQLPRVAILMVALMEARLTGEAVGSAQQWAPEVVVVILPRPRDIGAGAVEPFIGAISGVGIHYFPFSDFAHFLGF